jgi:peptidoglycan/LPS O-acetylase OafA/YrhL
MLLMEFAGYLALKLVPGITQAALLAILLGTVVVTVPIAALLYRFVEQPGIALGTRLARLTKAGSRST